MSGFVSNSPSSVRAGGDRYMGHRWDLPVLRYHKIMVIYPYPFLVVITQLFSCIIFINEFTCILTGSPG